MTDAVTAGSLDAIPTPALLLDLEAARGNVAAMAARMRGLTAELRPHIKAHKSAELAHMQIDAGAIGITAATSAEALAMARAGLTDIFIANQIVGRPGIDRVLDAARIARLRVALDDEGNLDTLDRAAAAAGVELGVLVEVDVGLGRGGARSVGEAVRLAERAADAACLRLDGLYGYEGHCTSDPDAAARTAAALRSMELLAETVSACAHAGIDIEVVSAGATGTFEATGNAPSVTEVQAGSYALMDTFHAPVVEGFAFALSVLSTVIGHHGNLLVLDAGRKSVDVGLRPLPSPDENATVEFVHEEHVGLRYDGAPPHRIGDRLRLVPGYAPTTVNLFGAYHVVEGDSVVDTWPVLARHGEP